MSIVNAIPCEYGDRLEKLVHIICLMRVIYCKMVNFVVALSEVSSKPPYIFLRIKKKCSRNRPNKVSGNIFPISARLESSTLSTICSYYSVVTIETKIREYQNKLLNNIVFINETLLRQKMID